MSDIITCPACLGQTFSPSGDKNSYALFRCDGCGTHKVHPQPSPAELAAFYESYVGTTDYTKKRDRKIARSLRRIRKLMRRAPGKQFLDVGCNYGFAVAAAKQLGLDAHGIDIDPTAVAASAQQFGPHFEARTVEDYAASGAKSDMVYTSEVIEHTLDPNSFAASLATILRPGGALYLTAPDGGHFGLPKDFTQWEQVIPPEHLTYFTRKGMKQMFERHGFTDVKFAFNMKPGIRLTARRA